MREAIVPVRERFRDQCTFVRENRDNLDELFEQSKGVVTHARTIFGESHALKCELAGEVLRSSGRLRLRVGGWSMLPSIFPGDTLVIERSECGDVEEGDIVLFSRDRRLFAHRVVKRARPSEPDIVTRGDAMSTADPVVGGKEMLGRVVLIQRNGKSIKPRKRMRIPERAVAALVRNSGVAARVVVGFHGLRQSSIA
ncbi:MAG: S24/S26 family peptidase [Candidatus Sulfotelmatobacter sp.]